MNNYEELSLNEMEQISGGKVSHIRTGDDQNAGIWKKWDSIGSKRADDSLENGTAVNIVGAPKFHHAKGRNYVEIEYKKKGKTKKGWVAASIVGLKR